MWVPSQKFEGWAEGLMVQTNIEPQAGADVGWHFLGVPSMFLGCVSNKNANI